MLQPKPSEDQSHVIRPSFRAYLQYARAAALPFVGIGAWGIIRLIGRPHQVGLIGLLLVIVVPIYLAVLVHMEFARIGWSGDEVWKTGLLGKRTVRRSQIAGIAFRAVTPAMSVTSLDQMVVYARDHRILLKVYLAYWSISDLRELETAVSPGDHDRYPLPVSQRQFNREFPTGGSWFGRHPNLMGVAGALLITVLICLGIALVEG
jgi:hypothetical protein